GCLDADAQRRANTLCSAPHVSTQDIEASGIERWDGRSKEKRADKQDGYPDHDRGETGRGDEHDGAGHEAECGYKDPRGGYSVCSECVREASAHEETHE